jgi:hypothetical protein
MDPHQSLVLFCLLGLQFWLENKNDFDYVSITTKGPLSFIQLLQKWWS